MKQKEYPEKIYCHADLADEGWWYGFTEEDNDNIEYTRSDLVPKWHKYPDEKPPERGKYYIVSFADFVDEAYYAENGEWLQLQDWHYVNIDVDVLAWREKIEPYKEN